MPTITVEGPQIDLESKRLLANDLSGTAAKAYGLPKDVMIVLIKENPPENVGLGGQLLIDRRKANDE